MRYDLCVYWVEDSTGWRDSAQEMMQPYLEDEGISVDFISESNGDIAYHEIQNTFYGFKKYDLFFVDLNVSSSISGSDIINSIRNQNIDVDILFYSANRETEIQKTIIKNLSAYEGVYVANRDTFAEKALSLIQKNVRKLLSIQNIRGKLMDCTSENDFIISSYVIKKYRELSSEQQEILSSEVHDYIEKNVLPEAEHITKFESEIKAKGIKNINQFMKRSSVLVPLELKYFLFKKIAELMGESPERFSGYFEQVVKKRNVLAHKKLELCGKQDHIKYCDTYEQLKIRACSPDCIKCADEHSISVEDWEIIRKKTNLYSQVFDTMLSKLD